MKIIVEYDSPVLGSGVFWEGDSSKIDEIRNLPAKLAAEEVVKDGKKRCYGMWTVSARQGEEK
jgi:hypothetical protein